MKDFILFMLVVFAVCVLCALPLYLLVNFICWVFNISFHLTLLQSFVISLLTSIVHKLLFSKGGK